MKKQLARTAIAWLAVALCADVAAQAYPAKAVRWVVPYPPGGSTDVIARTIGQKLAEAWNIQVSIDNRPGASGMIGTSYLGGTPEQAGAFFRSEMAKWSKVAQAAGLKPE